MLTPDVHPPHDGEPADVLHHAHHDHGPLGPDDFAVNNAALTPAQAATCRECGAIIKETPA